MGLKRIFITLTENEWHILDTQISILKKQDMSSFLRSEIPKLKKRFDVNPKSVSVAGGEQKEREIFITEESFNDLIEIKKHIHRPVATTVKELIFKPLLSPNFSEIQD